MIRAAQRFANGRWSIADSRAPGAIVVLSLRDAWSGRLAALVVMVEAFWGFRGCNTIRGLEGDCGVYPRGRIGRIGLIGRIRRREKRRSALRE